MQGEPILSSASFMLMELAPVPFRNGCCSVIGPNPSAALDEFYSFAVYYNVITTIWQQLTNILPGHSKNKKYICQRNILNIEEIKNSADILDKDICTMRLI